jgi:hypothetical protein
LRLVASKSLPNLLQNNLQQNNLLRNNLQQNNLQQNNPLRKPLTPTVN